MPRMQAEDITFSYSHDVTAAVFHNLTFSVQAGSILCLLGPNGTGKSTLLKCLSGILRVQQGRILFDGGTLHNFKLHKIAQRIGYVPQGLTSAFPFRIKDIIVMGRAPHLSILASPSKRDMDIAYEAMETTGISHLAGRPCNTVSGGEWQLALIARALVQKPQILLLDEPTSHLDLGNQMRILQVIKQLTSDGMTIIMASHFPDHAFLVADTAAILNRGQIAEIGAPDEVITEENLKSAYGVDVRVVCTGEPVERKVCFPSLKNSF
jgi:ABC-type cobalamin/Fe3+-siderophores transport system ATPase subunit